jgi:hypothetical protein
MGTRFLIRAPTVRALGPARTARRYSGRFRGNSGHRAGESKTTLMTDAVEKIDFPTGANPWNDLIECVRVPFAFDSARLAPTLTRRPVAGADVRGLEVPTS